MTNGLPEPTVVTKVAYCSATYEYRGWCRDCRDFTRDMTEPDATGYDCPDCGGMAVVGAESALIEGFIEVEETA